MSFTFDHPVKRIMALKSDKKDNIIQINVLWENSSPKFDTVTQWHFLQILNIYLPESELKYMGPVNMLLSMGEEWQGLHQWGHGYQGPTAVWAEFQFVNSGVILSKDFLQKYI